MSSSDISDTESSSKAVLGFQFEPLKKKKDAEDGSWRDYDEDSGEEVEKETRLYASASSWCKCGECEEMQTEKECLCCSELDSAHLYQLDGKLTHPQDLFVSDTE